MQSNLCVCVCVCVCDCTASHENMVFSPLLQVDKHVNFIIPTMHGYIVSCILLFEFSITLDDHTRPATDFLGCNPPVDFDLYYLNEKSWEIEHKCNKNLCWIPVAMSQCRISSRVFCALYTSSLIFASLFQRNREKQSIPWRFWFPGVTHRLRDGISNRKRSLKNVLVQLGRRCIFFGWRQTFLLLFFQFTGATVRQFSHLEMTANLCFYYCWLSLREPLLGVFT